MASDYLSKELKTDIRVGGFGFSPFSGLIIKDIIVKDRQNQTVIAAGKISIIPSKFSLTKKILSLRSITLDKATVQLMTHKGDTSLSFQFILDYFNSNAKIQSPRDTTPGPRWKISISSVELTDSRFHLHDENTEPSDTGMDYNNIDISHINMLVTGFRPDNDTLNARIERLSAVERSGLFLKSMSGDLSVSPVFLKAKNLKLETSKAILDLDMEFSYTSWEAYSDFLNQVKIKAEIRPSEMDLSEIGAFASELYDMKDKVKFEGLVKGTVNNFKVRDFRFSFGTNTSFFGNISAMGLPNVEETFVDMNIKSMTTNRADIEALKLPAGGDKIVLPDFLKNAGIFSLKGMFTGFYNDFVANARFGSNIGNIATDLTLKREKGEKKLAYIGQANAQKLNLGELFGSDMLGGITFRADINGNGLDYKTANLIANMVIDSLEINHYIYKHININGSLADKKFRGLLAVNDKNLQMDFDGLVDFSDSLPLFDFTSRIRKAQLFNMNIARRDSNMNISSRINVNFRGTNLDNIDGTIHIDSTWYNEGDKLIPMKQLLLTTKHDNAETKSYHLVSDFADADVTGKFNFSDLIPSLKYFISNYLASFRISTEKFTEHPNTNQQLHYSIRTRNSDPVTNVFAPFLKIAPNTTLEGDYNEAGQVIALNGKSDNISFYGMQMHNWYINATNRIDNISMVTGCSEFQLKKNNEKDTLTIVLDSMKIVSNVKEDTIHYRLTWNEDDSTSLIGGFLSFREADKTMIRLTDFNVLVDERYWNVSDDNSIIFDSTAISFNNLAFNSGEQFLKLNGRVSDHKQDTLYAVFNKVDLSNLDYFLGEPNLNFDGVLSGNLRLNDIFKHFMVLADLHLDGFRFNKEPLGDASFRVLYAEDQKRFDVKSNILYHGNTGTNVPLNLEGSYFLGEKVPRLDFDLNLKNLNLKMVAPFVSSFMSRLSGFASGDVKITGELDKPVFKGKLSLMRTEFRINYLNVPYSLADVVDIDENSFGFNNITIYDSLGNKASLNGKITHKHFRDVRLDLNIDMQDFSAFKNSFSQNNLFYGTARGSGNVKVTGPLDDITISVKAMNGGGTHVIIPISTTAGVGENDFIIFENKEADTIGVRQTKRTVNTSGLTLSMALQVNPEANLEVFFPDQLGSINARGNGNFTMTMNPFSDFTLGGTYTIQKGTFYFQLKNLMKYTLTIRDGSRIYWTGDPLDANISMSAVYKSRIPLEGLTTDQDLKSVRVPVECIVHLTGKLMNPDIAVSMNLPNVDETLRSLVFTSIDTTNAAEMTEQMINILVFNQFKSNQGANTGSLDVGNTSLSLLTNMANSFASKFTKNVSIGLNYSRSTASAGQEIDLAISTQVFNERLHLDGLFGMNSMNPNTTTQKASTIVGDINIAYDLTRSRRWQLRGFNRTNTYDNLNLNYAPYTQGFGISYRRDFNNWGDIFKKEKK